MSIVDILMDAVRSKGSVQAVIRGEINDRKASGEDLSHIATAIAYNVTQFKHTAEAIIVANADDPAAARKQVNNVINDVSRICREETGFSIVNSVRKAGNWQYDPQPPKPRSVATPPVKETEQEMSKRLQATMKANLRKYAEKGELISLLIREEILTDETVENTAREIAAILRAKRGVSA